MKVAALDKAREHLDLARSSAEQLTLEHGFKLYEQAWSQFLSQVSRLYSKIEQGSKGCGASEGWFGRKKHERKKDQLLSYLHHARDSDEHGLDYITRLRADRRSIKFPASQEASFKAWIKVNSDGSIDMRDPKVVTPTGEYDREILENPRVELVTVHDGRFHDHFDPPVMHLARPIVDRSPPALAEMTIRYLEELLDQASALPQRF